MAKARGPNAANRHRAQVRLAGETRAPCLSRCLSSVCQPACPARTDLIRRRGEPPSMRQPACRLSLVATRSHRIVGRARARARALACATTLGRPAITQATLAGIARLICLYNCTSRELPPAQSELMRARNGDGSRLFAGEPIHDFEPIRGQTCIDPTPAPARAGSHSITGRHLRALPVVATGPGSAANSPPRRLGRPNDGSTH